MNTTHLRTLFFAIIAAALVSLAAFFIMAPFAHAITTSVIINEFASDNGSSDWIELYNPTPSTVDLSGWTLKDLAGNPFTLPSSIASGGFVVVDASNKLNNGGDVMYLLDASSATTSSVAYGSAATTSVDYVDYAPTPGAGQSAYRTTDGGPTWAITSAPTKGATNVISHADVYVDASSGSDTTGNGTSGAPFATITHALSVVDSGGTINVLPGTYPESFNLDKPVTLKSTGGRDATTIALQSSPTYLGSLTIGASGVTITGFTIQGFDASGGGLASSDIYLKSGVSNATISNNKIEVGQVGSGANGDDGIGFLTTYTTSSIGDDISVTGNIFQPVDGSGSYRAFYINPGVNHFTFSGNTITGNFTSTSITQAQNGLVKDNTVTGTGAAGSRSAGLGTWGYPDATVWGHTTFTNNTISGTAKAIAVYATNDVTITNNTLAGNGNGVWVGDSSSLPFDVTTVAASGNDVSNEDVSGMNNASATTTPINVLANWWGSPTGPTDTVSSDGSIPDTNPGGTGSAALGALEYGSNWCTNASCVPPPTCTGAGGFDNFAYGSVNGQFGWKVTGPYDQGIVDNTTGFPSFGCKDLRISNAITSSSFGDQTFAASTTAPAGENVTNNHYVAQFDITTAELDEQPGLTLSVSPDNGSGSRMSYLSFTDTSSGIDVTFYDVQGTSNPANFVPTDLGTISRTAPHTIKFDITFVPGPSNDIVKIYIDGTLVHTGTSWENYYRYDSEQAGNGNQLFPIDTLIFRAGGTPAPSTSGKGFLIDNVHISTDTVPPPAPTDLHFLDNSLNTIACGATVKSLYDNKVQLKWDDAYPGATFRTNILYPGGSTATKYTNSKNLWIGDRTADGYADNGFGTKGQGVYTYQTQAKANGQWSILSAPCTIAYDHQSPTAHFDPTPPTYVNGDFDVSGVANDNVELKSVFFDVRDPSASGNQWKAGCKSGTFSATYSAASTTANASCTINTSNLTEGHRYILRIHAGDFAGYGGGQQQDLYLDTTRPNGSITAPADGSTITGDFMVTGTATDTLSGVDHVLIYVTKLTPTGGFNGYFVKAATSTWDSGTGTFSYHVTGAPDGKYIVKADVFDKAGNNHFVGPAPTITVLNVVPTLAITAPATDGDIASSTYDFTAQYDHGVTTNLDWAIRSGANTSCNGGTTLAGNVDGHHDASSFSSSVFSTMLDTTGWADGSDCFVVNDMHGLRAVRTFITDNTAPATTTITAPTNNYIFNSSPILDQWTPVTKDTNGNTDASGIAYYQIAYAYDDGHTFGGSTCPGVSISGVSGFIGCRDVTGTSRNHTPGTSEQGGVSIWVRAIDNAGNVGDWSDPVHYTYDTGATPGPAAADLIIVKHVVGGSDGTFSFDIGSASSATTTYTMTTSGGMATSSTQVLTAGTYNVVEATSAAWKLKNVSCDAGSPSAITAGTSVTLGAGDTVTCTFTNEPASSNTTVVYSGDLATSTSDIAANPSKWFFYNDQTDTLDNTLGSFVGGPNPAPLGSGSARISIAGKSDGVFLGSYGFAGTKLSEVTGLSYAAYRSAGDTPDALALQFDINTNGTASLTGSSYEGRLVFEPYLSGAAVDTGTWQTWDAATAAGWWFSHAATTYSGSYAKVTTSCTQASPCTLSQVLAEYPNIGISGATLFKAGSGWNAFTGNVDNFEMTLDDGTHATTTVTDFEPDTGTETEITSVSPEPSIVGNPYTVSWSVTAISSSATPTGTVTVKANGGTGCTAAASAGSCTITPSSAGSVTLVAYFSGDPGFDDSDSSATTVTHQISSASVTTYSLTSGGGTNGPPSGFSGFSPEVLGASTSTVQGGSSSASSTCSALITSYLGQGHVNDTAQVKALQGFLNSEDNAGLPVSGYFGPLTASAVSTFQLKYWQEVLAPWVPYGLPTDHTATGFVGKTTSWKINMLYCPSLDLPTPRVP